jgi:hypothetical protein
MVLKREYRPISTLVTRLMCQDFASTREAKMFKFSLRKRNLAAKRPTLMSMTTMKSRKSQRGLESIATIMLVSSKLLR